MDRLKSLSALIRVVELGSFSKCATELGIGQPTVSRIIEDLEVELGFKVLNRTTRSLTLTEEGKAVLEKAKQITDIYDELKQQIERKSAPKGVIRVTCPTALGSTYLIHAIKRFIKLYPEIKIYLRLSDTYLDLIDENLDVAIRVGELPSSLNIAKYVGLLPRIAVASEVYLSDRKAPTKLTELSKHSCLAVSKSGEGIYWEDKENVRQKIDPILVLDSYLSLKIAVDSGLGIGLGGQFLFEERGALRKGLVQVLKKTEFKPFPVNMVFRDTKNLPKRARLFIDFIHFELREQDWIKN